MSYSEKKLRKRGTLIKDFLQILKIILFVIGPILVKSFYSFSEKASAHIRNCKIVVQKLASYL